IASAVRRTERTSPRVSAARTVPTSSTMPVNTSLSSITQTGRIPELVGSVARDGRRHGSAARRDDRTARGQRDRVREPAWGGSADGGPAAAPAQQRGGAEERDRAEQPGGERPAEQPGSALAHPAPQPRLAQRGQRPVEVDAAVARRAGEDAHAEPLERGRAT